ncbi:MAG: hypothetical protein ACFFAJ_01830 [Candidatus Hodarchaeota archaeon]
MYQIRFIILLLAIVLLVLLVAWQIDYERQKNTYSNPISINNDNELAAVASSGTGSVVDPYIITDRKITNSTSNGIYITNTTKYLRIINCQIT